MRIYSKIYRNNAKRVPISEAIIITETNAIGNKQLLLGVLLKGNYQNKML
jgi:hypothetical protein